MQGAFHLPGACGGPALSEELHAVPRSGRGDRHLRIGVLQSVRKRQEDHQGIPGPHISNTDHITYYDRYDIALWLRQGEYVIAVMLGDGFQNAKRKVWDFMDNVFNSALKLAIFSWKSPALTMWHVKSCWTTDTCLRKDA